MITTPSSLLMQRQMTMPESRRSAIADAVVQSLHVEMAPLSARMAIQPDKAGCGRGVSWGVCWTEYSDLW